MNKNKNEHILPLWLIILLSSIGVGTICTTVITCIFGGYNETVFCYIIWSVASMLYGSVSCLIFGKGRMNLAMKILLDFLFCMTVTYAAAFLCGFHLGIGILVTFVIIYTIIFCVIYLSSKRQAEEINKVIKKRNNA